jgi:dCTP deaminase
LAILSDKWIREKALTQGMIEPFVENQRRDGCISYGLSSYGYDARVADEFKIFTNVDSAVVDPKDFDSNSFVDRKTDVCVIPPNSFALARTVEYFRVPRDVLVICLGKSTYARCGIIVNVTPLEPGWEGHVTLEFSNTTPCPRASMPTRARASSCSCKATSRARPAMPTARASTWASGGYASSPVTRKLLPIWRERRRGPCEGGRRRAAHGRARCHGCLSRSRSPQCRGAVPGGAGPALVPGRRPARQGRGRKPGAGPCRARSAGPEPSAQADHGQPLPADLPKEGAHYDLPIALALLAAMGIVDRETVGDYLAVGELALDGRIIASPGVLLAALHAASCGKGLICPVAQGPEARWAPGIDVIAAPDLISLLNHLKGTQALAPPQPGQARPPLRQADLRQVKGRKPPSARSKSRRPAGTISCWSARPARASR